MPLGLIEQVAGSDLSVLVAGETGKVSPAWLVSSYLLIAIAEISGRMKKASSAG